MSNTQKTETESWWARLARQTEQDRAEERAQIAQEQADRMRARSQSSRQNRLTAGGRDAGRDVAHSYPALYECLGLSESDSSNSRARPDHESSTNRTRPDHAS
jgi:hypothetical protein